MLRFLSVLASISILVSFVGGAFFFDSFPQLAIAPVIDLPLLVSVAALALIAAFKKTFASIHAINLLTVFVLFLWRNGPSNSLYKTDVPHDKLVVFDLNVSQFGNSTEKVDEIISIINSELPDVVCLQEFGLYERWPNVQAVAQDFAERIGMKYYDCSPHTGNIFCTALFSKYPIIEQDTIFQLLSFTNEAKSYRISIDRHEIEIINAHFQSFNFNNGGGKDHMSLADVIKAQSTQMNATERQCKAHHVDLIVGDFNAPPGSPFIKFKSLGFKDVQASVGKGIIPTHKFLPSRIDLAFVRKSINVLDLHVIRSVPSDHHAMVFSLAI